MSSFCFSEYTLTAKCACLLFRTKVLFFSERDLPFACMHLDISLLISLFHPASVSGNLNCNFATTPPCARSPTRCRVSPSSQLANHILCFLMIPPNARCLLGSICARTALLPAGVSVALGIQSSVPDACYACGSLLLIGS